MVSELLDRGKENAITTTELMRACNFEHKRDLTLQIAKERAEGKIICSTTVGQGGYFLPANREEIREFVVSMTKRAKRTLQAVKLARRHLQQIDGQTSFEELMSDR